MLLAGLLGQEETGTFDDDVGADFIPLQVGRVLLGRQANLLAIDDQGVAIDGDVALEIAMHGVVLQHVGQIVGLQQVVDADHFDPGEILGDGAKRHATDAAETVDANFDSHVNNLLVVIKAKQVSKLA